VTLRKRVLIALLASIVVAAVLLAVLEATNSKAVFLLQFPGFYLCALIWGIHGSSESKALEFSVFAVANALVYWPFLFGLSFLRRTKV
jgi:hypothetical protein